VTDRTETPIPPPSWTQSPHADGPNVLVVVLDDLGFGQLGCYGGSIRTPHIDALAANGLRYSGFHVAALCSPTRASLLTGRNHHAVGMGFLANFDTGHPGYRAEITPHAATLAEMLGPVGYGTYAVGKWHLTAPAVTTPAGPFDQWPTGRGFARYYGFLGGEEDQWAPDLWYDQHHVGLPDRDDYHLSEDLVDRSISFLSDHVTARPEDPFFLYLALGAAHAPHQAPADYIESYRGCFDHGWDEERQRVLARQVELGVVPERTRLPERNPGVRPWDGLSDDEKRVFARMQEVFAGYVTHADAQIGRLCEFLRHRELLEDTLMVVLADNGASGEGGAHGTANEYRYFLGLEDSFEETLAAVDDLGGPQTHNHYPSGWAQAGNTPLRMYKKHTYGGGVRVPLIVHRPSIITDRGAVRTGFRHVVDVAPTVLELTGVSTPEQVRGVPQMPLHGASFADSLFGGASARERSQYFETAGYRGIVDGRWKALTEHTPGTPFEDDVWYLYDLESDFSEIDDLAAEQPDRSAAMQQDWADAAARFQVLPLDDRMGTRAQSIDPGADRRRFIMLPGTRLLNAIVGPRFGGRPFTVRVHLMTLNPAHEGVLLAYGRRPSGFSLFLKDGRLWCDYNLAGRHTVVRGDLPDVVPGSPVVLELELALGRSEWPPRLLLRVGAAQVASAEVPGLVPAGLGQLITQCAHNDPSPVSAEYDAPFRFTGAMDCVEIELGDRVDAAPVVAVEDRQQ